MNLVSEANVMIVSDLVSGRCRLSDSLSKKTHLSKIMTFIDIFVLINLLCINIQNISHLLPVVYSQLLVYLCE